MSVLLHFLKWRLGVAAPDTATSEAEAACLVRHATAKRRLAEIGVWEGATTARLRAAMAGDARLFAIDPFPKGRLGFSTQRAIATAELARLTNGSVVWIRQTSTEAAANRTVLAAAPFDFVFLDALHTFEGLRDDWAAWAPLVESEGIVAIHDSRATPCGHSADVGSVRFTNEVILQDARFVLADAVDSLTVLRRR
jgi:predicted O-methyltransferase YrrM